MNNIKKIIRFSLSKIGFEYLYKYRDCTKLIKKGITYQYIDLYSQNKKMLLLFISLKLQGCQL
ncbi:MAG: hypothetical protein ACI9YH_005264 [Colwellia sp.]